MTKYRIQALGKNTTDFLQSGDVVNLTFVTESPKFASPSDLNPNQPLPHTPPSENSTAAPPIKPGAHDWHRDGYASGFCYACRARWGSTASMEPCPESFATTHAGKVHPMVYINTAQSDALTSATTPTEKSTLLEKLDILFHGGFDSEMEEGAMWADLRDGITALQQQCDDLRKERDRWYKRCQEEAAAWRQASQECDVKNRAWSQEFRRANFWKDQTAQANAALQARHDWMVAFDKEAQGWEQTFPYSSSDEPYKKRMSSLRAFISLYTPPTTLTDKGEL